MHLLKSFLLFLNLMFNFFIHPITLTMNLFMMTLIISLMMGMNSQTFWYSYILFLVFIGGILILLIYSIMLISKEKIYFKKNIFFKMMMMMMFLFSLNNIFFYNKIELNLFSFQFNENILILNKLYMFPFNILNIFMVIYLFFMLMVVMKITNFKMGMLRLI